MDKPSYELTAEEKELLRKYLQFYQSLDTGQRVPTTDDQKHFVAVCKGKAQAATTHEKAYAKYRIIQLAEQKKLSEEKERRIPEFEDGCPAPGWFTDAGWKQMRSQDYHEMKQRYS